MELLNFNQMKQIPTCYNHSILCIYKFLEKCSIILSYWLAEFWICDQNKVGNVFKFFVVFTEYLNFNFLKTSVSIISKLLDYSILLDYWIWRNFPSYKITSPSCRIIEFGDIFHPT